MGQQELFHHFNQIINLPNGAMLEDALWLARGFQRLIGPACGAGGNVMPFGNPGPDGSVELCFTA